LFPDATRKSYQKALKWELEEKARLEQKPAEVTPTQAIPIGTGCLTILEWLNTYLDDVKTRCVKKTYNEKRSSIDRLIAFHQVKSAAQVESLVNCYGQTRTTVAYNFLKAQCKLRSGYAANKDRKNLARAWNWGLKYLADFPRHLINPFALVESFPRMKKPRYVPPETDFWKVVDASKGQDKVMLLTYYFTAARRSEVFRLKLSDLDFEHGKIRLWTRKRRGGDLEYDWLPMSSELRKALLGWIEYRMAQPAIDKEHVFICLDVKGSM
jgi:integrase